MSGGQQPPRLRLPLLCLCSHCCPETVAGAEVSAFAEVRPRWDAELRVCRIRAASSRFMTAALAGAQV